MIQNPYQELLYSGHFSHYTVPVYFRCHFQFQTNLFFVLIATMLYNSAYQSVSAAIIITLLIVI